jgi:multidrug efflux pump subunit AcrB
VPQLFLKIDREKTQTLGVSMNAIFTALQSYLGTNFVNNFNFLGRTYQVNLQGDTAFRSNPDQIRRIYVRNDKGGWCR